MAQRIESTFKNMFLAVLATLIFVSLALSMTYNATKEPIAKAKEAKQKSALLEVMPSFDESIADTVRDASGKNVEAIVFNCLKGGESIGTAVQCYTTKGFSGRIDVMVGFLPDGTITKTVVVSHRETPGLGDKISIEKSDFPEQFWGKKTADLQTNNKVQVNKDGGKVDAITAATISSRAFCDAIDRAWGFYQENKNKGGNE